MRILLFILGLTVWLITYQIAQTEMDNEEKQVLAQRSE